MSLTLCLSHDFELTTYVPLNFAGLITRYEKHIQDLIVFLKLKYALKILTII